MVCVGVVGVVGVGWCRLVCRACWCRLCVCWCTGVLVGVEWKRRGGGGAAGVCWCVGACWCRLVCRCLACVVGAGSVLACLCTGSVSVVGVVFAGACWYVLVCVGGSVWTGVCCLLVCGLVGVVWVGLVLCRELVWHVGAPAIHTNTHTSAHQHTHTVHTHSEQQPSNPRQPTPTVNTIPHQATQSPHPHKT